MRTLILAVTGLLALPGVALAQAGPIVSQAVTPLSAIAFGSLASPATPVDAKHPLPTIGMQESFLLATGNVASAAVSVAGGDYILTQTCTSYGTLAFQVLGPNGTSWLPLASYSATDTGSGHAFALGSYAQVRIALTGTSGCSVMLSRVPA